MGIIIIVVLQQDKVYINLIENLKKENMNFVTLISSLN